MKKLILGALLAAAASAPVAAQQNMYLVKDNHLVATYDVNDVDYVTFALGDDVVTTPVWLEVAGVGKNTLTYKVNTSNPSTAYVHTLISYYSLNLYAMSFYNQSYDELPEGTQKILIETMLQDYGAYAAQGNQTFTMVDFEDDGTGNEDYVSRFSVRAGCVYYLVAAPLDVATQEIDVEQLVVEKVTTPAPAQSSLPIAVTCASAENEIATFDFSGISSDYKYVITALLPKASADMYISLYGLDFIINTWGAPWLLEEITADPRWNIFDTGEYTMLVRGVDANGDIADARCDFSYTAPDTAEGPAITIFSKSKENNLLSINFEISPSNVEEAYVYLDTEENVDDALNDGWELYEIASKSSALDITSDINRLGEYTYNKEITAETWQTLLIYAKDEDGNRTVCRINFNMLEGSQWDITNPAGASRSAKERKVLIKSALPRPLPKL